jgi:cytochrome c biogenesis protein CcmG/thiol:disulfide interchange protein DsbE
MGLPGFHPAPMSKDTPQDTRPPSRRKRILEWAERLVTLALLVFIAIRLGPQLEALVGIASDPERAPAFTLVTLDGDTIRSSDLAGKVVVLNFWATWCIPCRLERPSLEKLARRRAGGGLVVLGFATDAGDPAKVRAFVASHGITYPVGGAGAASRAAFGGISAVPTTFVIDRAGMIRHRVVGYFAPPALDAAVSRLLKEQTPGS